MYIEAVGKGSKNQALFRDKRAVARADLPWIGIRFPSTWAGGCIWFPFVKAFLKALFWLCVSKALGASVLCCFCHKYCHLWSSISRVPGFSTAKFFHYFQSSSPFVCCWRFANCISREWRSLSSGRLYWKYNANQQWMGKDETVSSYSGMLEVGEYNFWFYASLEILICWGRKRNSKKRAPCFVSLPALHPSCTEWRLFTSYCLDLTVGSKA